MSESGTFGAPTTESSDTAKPKSTITTDRPHGALALLLLRLAVAAVVITHGVQHLQDLDGFRAFVNSLGVPMADTAAVVTPIAEIAIGAALVLGLAVRVAGLGLAVLFVLVIIAVYSGEPLFPADGGGLTGELETLLAVAGVVFLLLGGGGLGVDRLFRGRHNQAMARLSDS